MYFIAQEEAIEEGNGSLRAELDLHAAVGIGFVSGGKLTEEGSYALFGESLIVRLPKNFAVKVRGDGLSKKTSHGLFEPHEPLWCVCRDQVGLASRQRCKRWIEELLAVRAKNRTRRSGS